MAEISIAVAGFSGIIVVLGERMDRLHAIDRLRVWWLLSFSAGGVVLGILPSVLGSASLNEGLIWRTWSALYLLLGILWVAVCLPMVRAMDHAERRELIGATFPIRVFNAAIQPLAVANIILQGLNALGVVAGGAQWACLAGLLFLVLASVITLVALIFFRPNRPAA
jgi:hypothetical protein